MYFNGTYVTQNYITAALWYRKAEAQNQPDAIYNLGIIHLNGLDIEQNTSIAIKKFKHAAMLKNKDAQYELSELYLKGIYIEKDYDEGMKWLHMYME